MRLSLILLLSGTFSIVHALPSVTSRTEDSDEITSRSSSAHPGTTSFLSHTSQSASPSHKPTSESTRHVFSAHTLPPQYSDRPVGNPQPVPTRTFEPRPRPTAPFQGPRHHVSISGLIVKIIGIFCAIMTLLAVSRCIYIYRRTPQRDRVLAVIHRHQLQREMEELDRNPPERRRSLVEPPPPYLGRPPEYTTDETTRLASPRHSSSSDELHTPEMRER